MVLWAEVRIYSLLSVNKWIKSSVVISCLSSRGGYV